MMMMFIYVMMMFWTDGGTGVPAKKYSQIFPQKRQETRHAPIGRKDESINDGLRFL